MADVANQLDVIERKVMNNLKDFQRATVERIAHLYQQGQKRVLVSDEVGLGKTLIAQGTIAKVAKMQKEAGNDLVKVVYICSNAAIAEQNLRKLRISKELRTENTNTSRLSMQHLNIFQQERDTELLGRYIQLIPLTPDTSFRMTSGPGTCNERALMYAILRRMPALKQQRTQLEIAMMDRAEASWEDWRQFYEKEVRRCNRNTGGVYLAYMIQHVEQELNQARDDGSTCLDELKGLCRAIRRNGNQRVSENAVIGELRIIFAKISLQRLEPDLVILDEFQKFKFLLNADPKSEIGMLTNQFFYGSSVRMLLLSATPYKMYSTLEEIEETKSDEHYKEFYAVMNFLNEDESDRKAFKTVWDNYSIQLKELTHGDTAVLQAKAAAEDAMYRFVCRTERGTAPGSADLVDDREVKTPISVLEQDIRSYVQASELLDHIGAPFRLPVDYIKSTPYLLSFMRDNYQLKRHIERYFRNNPGEMRYLSKDTLWLKRRDLDRYDKIPAGNARLEHVMSVTMGQNADMLLWVPPSRPYYELQGPYKGTDGFTKTLIFSSWEMVPRMISSLISYEAERKTVGALAKREREGAVHYFYSKEKRYPSARLNFALRQRKPAAMTLFCLLYPSTYLTDIYDPIDDMNRGLSLREIRREIKKKAAKRLERLPDPKSGRVDRSWYYIVPMLMDPYDYASGWLLHAETLANYDDGEEPAKGQKGFQTHLKVLTELFYESYSQKGVNLGRRPNDLLDVLADMALASPAVCANRTYRRYCPDGASYPSSMPSELARVYLRRMNTAEATAVVELACGRKSDDAHWQNVLTYGRHGNLQAVFDEYAHLIVCGTDEEENQVSVLHQQMLDGISIRTTPYTIDTLQSFKSRAAGEKARPTNIRTHFAAAFTKGDNMERNIDRKNVVRSAFNSPFRPFVLASTSIGQEGLDFHNYCRRIVHWNLPANPIDLEQREGRINRYKCLAIRQNVARRYGSIRFRTDIWDEMFQEAGRVEKTTESSDLIPYWALKETDDMVRIERIVPMYPYSRDGQIYERLVKILSLYRLTLGQTRQEELLEYLFQKVDDPDSLKQFFMNLSPYFKGKSD